MAGIPITGEGLAGMSKNQLYDIMSQMKGLIDQNQQQARQILVQNPLLTRALFQAQIMLGMVKPPHVVPNIQPEVSQNPPQSVQPASQSSVQPSHLIPGLASSQDQSSASQTHTRGRMPHQNIPPLPNTSAMGPTINQSYPTIPSAQQLKGHPNIQTPQISLPQSSQVFNVPPANLHCLSQPPSVHSQLPTASSKMQQLPSLQPPLPPQLRSPPMPNFHQQPSQHMGPGAGYQHAGTSQMHHLQQFHPGVKSPASVGPPFAHGQPPLHNQPPSQSHFQVGGSHFATDFRHSVGNSMQVDRGSSWMPGPPENTAGMQIPGPPSLPAQMAPGNQPPQPPAMTPQMEQALLQQVMSLSPEQINLLPPDQRQQVLQLQQMLRQ